MERIGLKIFLVFYVMYEFIWKMRFFLFFYLVLVNDSQKGFNEFVFFDKWWMLKIFYNIDNEIERFFVNFGVFVYSFQSLLNMKYESLVKLQIYFFELEVTIRIFMQR